MCVCVYVFMSDRNGIGPDPLFHIEHDVTISVLIYFLLISMTIPIVIDQYFLSSRTSRERSYTLHCITLIRPSMRTGIIYLTYIEMRHVALRRL